MATKTLSGKARIDLPETLIALRELFAIVGALVPAILKLVAALRKPGAVAITAAQAKQAAAKR